MKGDGFYPAFELVRVGLSVEGTSNHFGTVRCAQKGVAGHEFVLRNECVTTDTVG